LPRQHDREDHRERGDDEPGPLLPAGHNASDFKRRTSDFRVQS
jgi:hypothetical protein